MVLTGRAGLVALVGALAVALAPAPGAVLLILLTLLLVTLLVDVSLAASVRRLSLTRTGATSGRQGEPTPVVLTVTNDGKRRLRGALRDAWPPSAGATPRAHRVDIPPGERRRFETVLVPTRRGDRAAAVVAVRSVGPLGLAGRQGRHRVPWVVRVLPPFASRRFLPEKLARLRQLDGSIPVAVRGRGTEFDSLRDYVVGDDVRSIDWRATARRDAVVVRTWRPERDRRAIVVVDTSRTSAGRVGDIPRLDSALDASLLLAAVAGKAGDRVDLLAYDRVVRASVEGATRGELLPTLVQSMALLEPSLVELDARGLVAQVLRRVRQRSLVVIFTSLDAAAVHEGLLPALPALTTRHLVVVAAVGDPRIEELAAGRSDAEAVYGASAAEQARAERRRTSAVLRRAGVEVVDAPPATFAPAVADAYLSLKAAGRL